MGIKTLLAMVLDIQLNRAAVKTQVMNLIKK
jgi:hypothetical protein